MCYLLFSTILPTCLTKTHTFFGILLLAAQSSVVNVRITVTDINDNAPQFDRDVYTTVVPEFLALSASALQVCVLSSGLCCVVNAALSRSLQLIQMPLVKTLKSDIESWALQVSTSTLPQVKNFYQHPFVVVLIDMFHSDFRRCLHYCSPGL